MRLNDQLLAEAKQHAAKTGCTLTALLEDALRTFLSMNKRSAKTARAKLPTFKGGGLRPGVDLDNSADLLDIMEDKNGVS
ncbi:MAG: antitoxin VapB43 [Nitrospirales bacterium]|nr:MAG: antitoxin VapB43 [Nitrospirales bacterium]